MEKLNDCNYCEYCSPKESEQTRNKEPHMCLKYKKQLRHMASGKSHSPLIRPCQDCIDG